MKRIITVVLTLALLVAIPAQVRAEEKVGEKLLTNEEFGYTISETVDEFGRVVLKYENPKAPELKKMLDTMSRRAVLDLEIPEDVKYAKMKSVLVDLGKEGIFLDDVSAEDYEEYLSASEISSLTTYYREAPNGETEAVSYEEFQATNDRNAAALASSSTPYDSDVKIYDTFRIQLYMTHFGKLPEYDNEQTFRFEAEAHWTYMPTVRGVDSLSIVSNYTQPIQDTINGWYFYVETYQTKNIFSVVTEETQTENKIFINQNDIHMDPNAWFGPLFNFDLPNDVNEWRYGYVYSNFACRLEYRCVVEKPDESLYFGAHAQYEHIDRVLEANREYTYTVDFDSASLIPTYSLVVSDESIKVKYGATITAIHYVPN